MSLMRPLQRSCTKAWPWGKLLLQRASLECIPPKKIFVDVSLNSNALRSSSNLGNELSSGMLTLSSKAKLTGKLELMFIMKKKKSATMDCTMKFDLSSKAIQGLECK